MIRLPRFSTFNLALGYIILSIAVLVLFATPLGISWYEGIDEARNEHLRQDVQRLTDIYTRQGVAGLATAINSHFASPFGVERIVILADASMARLAGNLPAWPLEMPDSAGTHDVSIAAGGLLLHVVAIRAVLPDGYHLLVGREVSRFRKLEMLFWYGLTGAAVAILLLGLLGGTLIRRALFSQLHNINQTASGIVGGDLSRRLPTRNRGGEFGLLAQTLNRMLDQIEHLIHGVRNVSNAIAHDLRTPLGELRAHLEELLVTRPDSEETFAGIEIAVADVDRVIGIFDALLRLAEIDAGARRAGFVRVNVTAVAGEAAEFYGPVAEINGVRLSFESAGEPMIAGDRLLVAQAIGNLIENALKYVQKIGTIVVAVGKRPDGSVEISVADDGPGISDEDKPKVTERFYRGDASRGTPGVGLGLSLVAAVAKLHGGFLELSDNHPGLRATLVLSPTP